MGYIIRTAGLGRTKAELSRDLSSLLRLWESIQEKSGELPAPCLVYQEADIVLQTIRDYFTADTDEILVDNREVHKDVMDFLTVVMPRVRGKVHPVPGEETDLLQVQSGRTDRDDLRTQGPAPVRRIDRG